MISMVLLCNGSNGIDLAIDRFFSEYFNQREILDLKPLLVIPFVTIPVG